MSSAPQITWGHVRDVVVPASYGRSPPTRSWWGFRCPECKAIVIPQARWIEGTHDLVEYWKCERCGYEYAHIRPAQAAYAEYASKIYRPEEVVKRPRWL